GGASMVGLDGDEPPEDVLYERLTAAALWLAIGVGLLVKLARTRALRRTASIDAALALLLSGLPFACAYLVIGVATELRYLLWSLIAIFTALVVSLPELRVRFAPSSAVAG